MDSKILIITGIIILFFFNGCSKIGKNTRKAIDDIPGVEKLIQRKFSKNIVRNFDERLIELGFNERLIKNFSEQLGELQKAFLSDCQKNRKLVSLLNENPQMLRKWKDFSETSVSGNVNLIKYFHNLNLKKSKFLSENTKPDSWNAIYHIRNTSRTAEVVQNDKVVAKISQNEIITKSRRFLGRDNYLINEKPLINNFTYNVDNIKYSTDDLGRIKNIQASFSELPKKGGIRNSGYQIGTVEDGGIPEIDDGGHIIASSLGGPTEFINMVPVNKNINRGPYRTIENQCLKAVSNGKKVEIKINLIYDDGNTSRRPDLFDITYTIDGIRKSKILPNPKELN